jgi:hypothetical protein
MERVGARRNGYVDQVAGDEPILRGQDESAPFRALNRVILVVAVVVVIVGAAAYALWSALN